MRHERGQFRARHAGEAWRHFGKAAYGAETGTVVVGHAVNIGAVRRLCTAEADPKTASPARGPGKRQANRIERVYFSIPATSEASFLAAAMSVDATACRVVFSADWSFVFVAASAVSGIAP